MGKSNEDHRSPLSVAVAWVSQVTSIALEMVVPAVVGLWIDRKLGTGFVFVLLGGVLGLCLGMLTLLRVAGTPGQRERRQGKDPRQ